MKTAQYRIATLVAAMTAIAALCGLIRGMMSLELPAFLIGITVLVGMLVFAEDIWKWLPR